MNPDITGTLRSTSAELAQLPEPQAEAVAHSQQLVAHLQQLIAEQGGCIPFYLYMEEVLYAPGLGYYSAGSRKLGREGDFVTAPEISPLFSRCLANAVIPALTQSPYILEVGAGSGRMAADMLQQLSEQNALPEHYFILERSAELRQRQQQTIAELVPACLPRVQWLDELPDGFNGVVVANELLDALPVHRVVKRDGQWLECYVVQDGEAFAWDESELSHPRLQVRMEFIESEYSELQEGYCTEVNLAAEDWLQGVSEKMQGGYILLVDYGYSQHEYYHPQRKDGTLMCHYRHRAHDDPFVYPGLQDLTAHVDFTAIADAALEANLKVRGYTTQAFFLMDNDLAGLAAVEDSNDVEQQLQMATQVRRLTLPQEMGESFKVILLSKNRQEMLPGFMHDMRDRL